MMSNWAASLFCESETSAADWRNNKSRAIMAPGVGQRSISCRSNIHSLAQLVVLCHRRRREEIEANTIDDGSVYIYICIYVVLSRVIYQRAKKDSSVVCRRWHLIWRAKLCDLAAVASE
jgi:hypothetical protein